MKFREQIEKEDFFECLKKCTEKGIEKIHKCFKAVIIQREQISDEDYDREKAEQGVRVAKFQIKDGKRSFECTGTAFGGTPAVDELHPTIDHVKEILSTIGLYTTPSFPDEALVAHIVLTHQNLEKPRFQVSIRVEKRSDRLYQGTVTTSAKILMKEYEEIKRLLQEFHF